MHEGLAAEDAEEAVAVLLGVVHQSVQLVELDRVARRLVHIDPAALAAEVAAVEDGDVEERREILALLHPFLEEFTERAPLNPKFHAIFIRRRGSVVRKIRLPS